MTDYAKNIQAFYERDDYKALAGQPGATAVEASFKELTYVPRKTKPLPGMMAGTMLQEFALQSAQPTALYLHIPFCNLRCSYCSFYRNPFEAEQVEEYVQALLAELDFLQQQGVFAKQRPAAVFFGGGTPSVLNPAQISALLNKIHSVASLADDCEVTFESSIYDLSADKLAACIAGGVNRFSFGVQAFDTHLRRSLGRLNTKEEVTAKLEEVAVKGVKVIIDLIYGLPKQTPESFAFTLKRVAELNPDRLSVFNYAHLPTIFAAQRKIKDADLPSPQQKLDILQETIAFLTQSGYQFIGMDHFARPDDELAVAQREGVLHRNFQGYTTQGDTDLLGMGVSAISMIGDCYAQNQKELKQYYQQVDEQGNALWRGIALTRDDCIRRDVIKSLICNFRLDYAPIEQQWDLLFADYFAEDLKLLAPLAKDGLVDVDEKGIQVTAKGRLLIRNICMCFDTYLRQKARMQQFSRVI